MSNNNHSPAPYADILDDQADPNLQRLTAELETLYTAAAPDPAFAAALRTRIERAPANPPPVLSLPSRRRRLLGHRSLVAAAAAALAIAALGSVLLFEQSRRSVSAQEILSRAQTVATSSAPVNVRSYHQRSTATWRERGATVTNTIESWYGGNGRVRIEQETRGAAGASTSGTVMNPSRYWKFYTEGGQTYVHTGTVQGQAANTDARFLPGNAASSITEVLALYGRDRCPSSTVRQQGEATVAGRPVYVIEVSGTATCNTKQDPAAIDRSLISVDSETFLPLKTEAFTADGTLLTRDETTSIEYNITIPESTFTYTPPPGAIINPPDDKDASGQAVAPSAEAACLKRENAAGRGSTAEATCRASATPTATPTP